MPALTALAADEGHQSGMGAIMGVLNMAMSVGMMLGPVLAGVLTEIVSLRVLFVGSAVVGGIGTLLFARLTVEHPLPLVPTSEAKQRQVEAG